MSKLSIGRKIYASDDSSRYWVVNVSNPGLVFKVFPLHNIQICHLSAFPTEMRFFSFLIFY